MTEKEPVVAIAHDYLTQKGGAERVVLAIHRVFPDAKIYTTLYDPASTYPEFADAHVVTSFLNRFHFFRSNHRAALPFLALAASSMKIPADIVVSSSSGWAHGFKVDGINMVYCHSPARWLYLTEQYLGSSKWYNPVRWALKVLGPGLRRWDRAAAARADKYVANSTVVRQRIKDVYKMEVDIIHPPHSVDIGGVVEPVQAVEDFAEVGQFFLVVSRLLPYKNVDRVIDAFQGSEAKLLVVGAGPLGAKLKSSCPPNVRIVSNLSDAQMRWVYSSARAVIAVSHEDFGITPLEGGAWGKPTIALRGGGYLDTIVEGVTGIFIEEPTSASIRKAVDDFLEDDWDPALIASHVETFSEKHFRDRLLADVQGLADSK